MNTYIWCAVGLIAGGIVAVVASGKGKTHGIETVAVAMFGAVIGGDLVPSLLGMGSAEDVFRPSSLAFSVVGAITSLALLGLMRRSVGPLKPHREKKR